MIDVKMAAKQTSCSLKKVSTWKAQSFADQWSFVTKLLSDNLHHEHKAAIPTSPVLVIIGFKSGQVFCRTMYGEGWKSS